MKRRFISIAISASTIMSLIGCTSVQAAQTSKNYISKRLAGVDRFETALSIAAEYNSSTLQNVIISTAYDFPDALSGSVLAAKLNAPILLVGKNAADSEKTLDYINAHLDKTGRVYILGSEGAVGTPIISKLQSLGYKNFTRLAGANRIETNLQIVDSLNVAKGTPVIIATQNDFPDALSISGIASKNGYPILLSSKDSLDSNVLSKIKEIAPSKIYIVGSSGVVGTSVENTLKTICSNVIRMGGKDRFETSTIIAKAFSTDATNAIVATGFDFPDALTGSVLAEQKNAPILLVNSSDVSMEKSYLDTTNITNLFVLGSEGAVSKDALNKLTNASGGETTPTDDAPQTIGLKTSTGYVTSKTTYTDREIPDKPTLDQMLAMSVTVTHDSNPELFSYFGDNYGWELDVSKMNLTGSIYHFKETVTYLGQKHQVDMFYKMLKYTPKTTRGDIERKYTWVRFDDAHLSSVTRNVNYDIGNEEYWDYMVSEK